MIHALETGRPSQAPARDLEDVLSQATAPAAPEFVGVATKREINGSNRSFVIGALSLACLAAALMFATVRGALEQSDHRAGGTAESRAPTTQVSPGIAGNGAIGATAPTATVLGAPTDAPKANPISASDVSRPGPPKATPAIKAAPVAPAKSATPAANGPCRLPYTVDAEGHRHYKAECL
jgi:hypothetical protein